MGENGMAAFVEGYSDDEGLMGESDQKHPRSHRAPQLNNGCSSPLLLAYSITTGRPPQEDSVTSSPGSCSGTSQLEEEAEEPVEEWMILGGEEQVGDSSIQLNVGYWSSSEEETGAQDADVKSDETDWTVSAKDKFGGGQSLPSRYFSLGRSLICNICKRTDHLTKNCYNYKKCPTCVLCGIQGHVKRECPSRPCLSCGLPSHDFRSCEKPPVWKQLCLRCGMMGHLSDTCPDSWRQYHMTIQLDVPVKPQTVQRLKHKKFFAHCYNCSKIGHFGYECTQKRMLSGTFPSLPYICHYDTIEDIIQQHTMMQKKEPEGIGSMLPSNQHHLSDPSANEKQQVLWRNRTKQETCARAARRRTWPERRRERQEVKKLRREAQARREGGLSGRFMHKFHDEESHMDPFKCKPRLGHQQSTTAPPPKKKRREESTGRRSKKSREAERWRKRGGMKRGDLYPHCDMKRGCENLLSPKQRVRHRRR